MKKNTFLILFVIVFNTLTFGQKKTSLERANEYLLTKGEVVFTFRAKSQSQFLELNKILSVSHKRVDQKDLEVEAYANKEQFERFLTYGLAFTVDTSDNEIPQERTQRKSINGKIVGTWDTTWDAYPKYSEYVSKMQYWATTYPNLCTLQSIGTTQNGRQLYVLKISDNASTDETEPEFFYTSSMHGDEITGYPTMLRLIDYLLTNYGTSEVADLINGTEIFINPLANPDGSYKSVGNDIYNSVGNTPTRGNANGVDLNRNYPDAIGGMHPDGLTYQPETLAFLNFEATRNFVLAANYHGGTEVVNFPLDTSYTPGTGAFSYHPHDNYFKFVSQEYAQLCQTADGNLNYMDAVYNTGQFPGTTNGAAWYSVYGGRQDCNNYFNHSKEVTVEISDLKTPLASDLPFFWDRNRQALLNYVKQASYGLQGVVTNVDGNPIHAKVYIGGTFDNFGSWVETSPTKGDYHKVQIAGTYNVIFEAPGYATQTISATINNNTTTTLNVTMVPSTSLPTTSNDVAICQGAPTTLTATGTGTIKWYDSLNATSPVATGTSFPISALNTTSSYYAENEVVLANVGPTTVSGAATANATVANEYLIFNCSVPTKLKSVLISSSAAGQIYVELQNSSGVMLESKVVRLATSGNQDIALDFFLPIANGLRLVSRELSNTNLICETAKSAITYPITSGAISITGSSVATGNKTFFQFFNWKLEPVKSNRKEVIITVNPTPVAGTVSSNQTICSGSQPASITLTGNTGTIQWQSSTDNSNFSPISGETSNILSGATIGNLTATKYFRAVVTSGICPLAISGTVIITVPTSTTWNGNSWDNGAPTSATTAIISGNYNVLANINACTLTINNNAIVTIPSSFNVTLNGALTVNSGSFTLNNNANLIQSSNDTNSGNIIVKRETTALMLLDYVLWSSPVAGQLLQPFSPTTLATRFYTYNPTTNLYNAVLSPSSTNFNIGTGYLIRMPNNHPTSPTIWQGQFQGVPNNGNYNLSVANNTYNAVGNPYPSTIDANTFIDVNGITEALYFWRKTNNAATTSYATYTKAGGIGNAGGSSSIVPNGTIQVGQGFIVKPNSNTLSFTNAMRSANNSNQFLKSKAIENNRIWLNLSKETVPVNQMMVAYMTGATLGIDPKIDGRYINDNATALNSLVENEEFVIQGRSLPFEDTDIVPLTFKANASGNYTIAIDHVDGLFSGNQNIFLNDKLTNTVHDIKNAPYTFTSVAGIFNNRFQLLYKNNSTLGTETTEFSDNTILVFLQNKILNINSEKTPIKTVKLFTIDGRLLFEQKNINNTSVTIKDFGATEQAILVQISSNENKVITKKVVY